MGRSGVMLFVAISTITISQVWGACKDFTCTYNPPKGHLQETMYVDAGDKCGYYTQEGDRYPPPRGKPRLHLVIVVNIEFERIFIAFCGTHE